VRGYAFESLGVKDGLATVPGRYYVVASVEATRWINATWGIATFVDAGNAFDNLSDFKVALGYGVGARVRTPIGPFRFDVAYGQDSKQVRVHFSVGLAF
jgi:translocation and assembly module TamA